MPITLQDLYAHPLFIEKAERPIKAKIMSWTFEIQNPKAVNPSRVPPVALSLGALRFSGEDEERIQGEVIVSARMTVHADIATTFEVQSGDQIEHETEDFGLNLAGHMNFSLPWGWQARDLNFVAESVQVALNDLQRL
jgi:hypothetical protein